MVDPIVKRVFAAWSPFYDAGIFQRIFFRRVHAAVRRQLPASSNLVLDLGCGTGQLLADVCERFPTARALGVDISGEMLAVAARRLGRAATLIRADVSALPVASGSADLVLSTIAYHWYPEPVLALAEARRVITSDGRFLLACLVAPFDATLGHVRLATERTTRARLIAAGFAVDGTVHVVPRVAVFRCRPAP